MECRERVLTALNLEEPDRVPCHAILIDANNSDEILGKPKIDDFDALDKVKQNNSNGWVEEMSNLIEGIETTVFSRCVEAAAKIGLDVMQVGIIPFYALGESEDGSLLLGDIYGRVWSVLNNEGNFNPYYLYGTTTSKEKWKQVRENLEGPALDKYKKMAKKFFRRINKKHKDKIFVIVTNDYLGAFEAATQGLGWSYYARMVKKDPRFIKEVHTVIATFTAELYKSYMEAGAEVFVESGDLAYKTGPMMSPKKFSELVLPGYRIITDTVHEKGRKVVLHTDGHITPLLDFIVDCGFDGLHSLEPTAGVDLTLVKKKVGNKLCLLGNIDVAHVLTYGTKEEVFDAVKFAIMSAGPGGGFIISAANMHPAVKVQNLKWMIEATQKYGIYPLKIE
ncbi:MAG: uroporphyrinogen decarboxylase family protein [Candidatus Thorarchaeota archaeon]